MSLDQFESQPEKPRSGGGRLVAAGVVGACALGVGLGLWARPAAEERPGAPRPVAAAKPIRPVQGLQIVVDDTPAPIGRLLEVLPADLAPAEDTIVPPPPEPPMTAPRRPPSGLMKVDVPIEPEPTPIVVIPAVRVAPEPVAVTPKPPKAKVAQAAPKPKAKPEKVLAKAEKREPTAKSDKAKKTEVAKADRKAKPTKDVKLAKADKPTAKTKAKAKPVQTAKVEKSPTRLAKAVEKMKAAKAQKAAERKKAVALAEAKAKSKAAAAKKAPARKVELAKATPPKKPVAKPKPVGEGPMRVARNGCTSADPGESLACANPRLTVRERQLQRAYQQAEASGVPADTLRRQQERWRAARAAAAREAPWAVEEVYEARIAELNDMARERPY